MMAKPVAIGFGLALALYAGALAAPAESYSRLGIFGPPLGAVGLCSRQHVTSASTQSTSPDVQTALARFVTGTTSDYADMSAGMAQDVRTFVTKNPEWRQKPLRWTSQNGPGRFLGINGEGDEVYAVPQKGGKAHLNIAVNRDGKIEAAYRCDGPDGLSSPSPLYPNKKAGEY